jgi:hypothetical protein
LRPTIFLAASSKPTTDTPTRGDMYSYALLNPAQLRRLTPPTTPVLGAAGMIGFALCVSLLAVTLPAWLAHGSDTDHLISDSYQSQGPAPGGRRRRRAPRRRARSVEDLGDLDPDSPIIAVDDEIPMVVVRHF